jgi:DNA-binding NarL/FixJ family response regulator
MPATIRVALVEPQVLFAEALHAMISDDGAFCVVGQFRGTAPTALAAAQPDLIVVDLDGYLEDPNQLLASYVAAVPSARVCVLATRMSGESMQRALEAGAEGYIAKDIVPAEFVRALRIVAGGSSYVDPRIAGGLLRRRNAKSDLATLSTRETQVLRLIAEGLANKQISARLCLSEKTVKNHISRIFSKINVQARTQAAVHAIRAGIV